MLRIALIAPKVGFATKNDKLMALVCGSSEWSPDQFWTGTGNGLLTVAALCPDWAEPIFIDEKHETVDLTADYDLVGITAMTQQAPRAYEIAAAFRKRKVPVVIGGIHATVLPEEVQQHADAVVVGEAESVWHRLLEDFRAGRLQPVYRSGGPIDLADSPVPRFDLLNRQYYDQAWIQTSRGCPHDCDYCVSSKVFGGRYRTKSIEKVSRELDAVLNHFGKPRLAFSDDNLLANRKHAQQLMEDLAPRRLRWLAQADVAVAENDSLLESLRVANCRYLFIGFETLSPQAMRGIDHTGWKAKRVEGYARCVQRIQSYGIGVVGAFIVGLDEDDSSAFDAIGDFITTNRLYGAAITVLTPFPGTRLRDRLAAENRLLPAGWDEYTAHDLNHLHPRLTPAEIGEGLLRIYRRVFS
jgi:radical SAM superfamily enzyme YgiQ (UPF0313 family)